MPTGYTAYIEDGDITTGKEFLKLCTRAFGVAIDQKEVFLIYFLLNSKMNCKNIIRN